jgi:GNAT superfamily N-acetyltransferase
MLDAITIRKLRAADRDLLAQAFEDWHKDYSQFDNYYLEQLLDKRFIFVAHHNQYGIVGYVTILWDSPYEQFWRRRIPEIVDLNVMTPYQRHGIGTALIRACEAQAAERGYRVMGISVVQNEEYAAANRLYPALGYIPDGFGITAHDNELHLVRLLIAPET